MTEHPTEERAPLMFWVVIAAAAFYLVLRFLQGIAWVLERL